MTSLGRAVRRFAERSLASSPLQSLFEARARDRLTVLTYHAVDDPSEFARQMQYVATHRTAIGLPDLLAALDGARPLPENATLVTFDDGYRSVYEFGLPVLERLGVPAILFVITDLVDSEQPFWWDDVGALIERGARVPDLPGDARAAVRELKRVSDERRRALIGELRAALPGYAPRGAQLSSAEIRELAARGVAIGNHTQSHPCLDRCANATIERELRSAHEALSALLGQPPLTFAYPNGNWDARAEALLRELGYRAAFVFDHRIAEPSPPHPLRISRLSMDCRASFERFRITLSGLHPAIHTLRQRHFAPAS